MLGFHGYWHFRQTWHVLNWSLNNFYLLEFWMDYHHQSSKLNDEEVDLLLRLYIDLASGVEVEAVIFCWLYAILICSRKLLCWKAACRWLWIISFFIDRVVFRLRRLIKPNDITVGSPQRGLYFWLTIALSILNQWFLLSVIL